MIEIDDLRCCEIFADLNERELAEVAKLATIEKRGAGSRVIAEGTNAAALYLLREGKVAVRMTSRDGHEVVIDELGPGGVFGWSAVLDHQMFKANIWTLEDSTIIVMDGDEAQAVVRSEQPHRVSGGQDDRRHRRRPAREAPRESGGSAVLRKYLAPVRGGRHPCDRGEEVRCAPCPAPSAPRRTVRFSVVNETEQYRCRNCGMVYYTPWGARPGPSTPSSGQASEPEARLGDNWSASTPGAD